MMGDNLPTGAEDDHGSLKLTVDSFDSAYGNAVNSSGDRNNNRRINSEGVEEQAVEGAPSNNHRTYTPSLNANNFGEFDATPAKDSKLLLGGDGDATSHDEEPGRWSKNSYAEELVSKSISSSTKAKDSADSKSWAVASDLSTRMTANGQVGDLQEDVSISDDSKRANVFLKQHSYIGEDAIQGLNAVQGAVRQSPIASELNSLPVQRAAVRNGDSWPTKPAGLASQFQMQSYYTPLASKNTTIMPDSNNSGQRVASRDRQSPLVMSSQSIGSAGVSTVSTNKSVAAGAGTGFQFFRASSTVMRVTEDGTVTDCSTENRPATKPTTISTVGVRSVSQQPVPIKTKTTTSYDPTTSVVATGSPLRGRSTAAVATGRGGNSSAASSGVIDGYDPYDDVYRPGDGSRAVSNTRLSAQGSNVASNADTEVFTNVVPLRSQPSVIQTDNARFVVCVDTPASAIQLSGVQQPHAPLVGDVLRSTISTYDTSAGGKNVVPTHTTSSQYIHHRPPQQPRVQHHHHGLTASPSILRSASQQRVLSNYSDSVRAGGTRIPGQQHAYRCRGNRDKSSGFASEMAKTYDMVDSFQELLAEMAEMADEVVLIKHPPNSRYQSYSGIPTDLAEKGHVLSFSTVDSQGVKQQDGENGFEAVVLWPKSDGVDTFSTTGCGTTSVQRLREVGPTVSLKVTRSAKNSRAKSGPPENRF